MLKDTLYAQHLEERGGKLLETAHGYAEYRVIGNECFIVDMHVAKEFRKTGEGRGLTLALADVAKAAGCTTLTGNIQISDPGCSNTLIASLTVGFKVVGAVGQTIVIEKELGAQNG